MQDEVSKILIQKMPKVEIHLHLEGAFNFEFLFGLIQKYSINPEVKNIEELRRKFIFKDFKNFIETWFWKNQFFRAAEDFEESTYHTLKNLSLQNVIYAEVFFSPWDFSINGLNVEEITEATISGIRRAEDDFPIKCSLIADIVRDHGFQNAVQRLNQITPYLNKGIIGIGLGGNERDFPPLQFKEVFQKAKKRGFRRTVHAGEAAGADSIWDALLILNAERIGHGVRAIEDPKLVDYLLEKQIPLEICITSNLKTMVFKSITQHPFLDFYKKGLKVTVSSDDPSMFGSNITDELILIHEKLNLSLDELFKITKNSIEGSFLSDSDKKTYSHYFDEYESKIKG